ncbi:type II secretion system F family protein [Sphingomicrobium flavum]|uniref:type II secretion system F family protein n=1 Tax=Sphingomicrobium flavum TaxID=1229164 RepID=UPI0021ADB02C|nr:type II secretion system F family protein [Sphingomicrobium flavum]
MLLLLIFAAVLAIVGVAWLVINGTSPQKAYKRRIDDMIQRHAEGGTLKANAQLQIRKLMSARNSKMDGFANTFLPRPALMKLRLEQTGKDISLGKYFGATLGIIVVLSGLLLVQGAPWYFALATGIAAGVGIPHWYIGRLIKKRMSKFNVHFPDAIELMVRGLRSGLPITETLGVVASEIPAPVGTEFKEVSEKMKIGRTMEAALQETADRLGTPEFQFFVITLAIQRETGGNLAETLANLADVLRKRIQMRLKIRAMSSESKASAMIVGALPFIVFTLVYMMNPEYMENFFIDERLMVAGIGGLVWMSIGVFMMAKMVNFEI